MSGTILHGRPVRSGGVVMIIACLIMTIGCHQKEHFWLLANAETSLPAVAGDERPLQRAGTPGEWLAVRSGGGQTVLVASRITNDPARVDDESSQTFVVVLDGPPAEGRYEVTPDNGRLILHSVFMPARRPYEGIEGYVKILSVSDQGVRAKCVFRNVLRHSRAESYVLRGTYRFEPPVADELLMKQAGIAYTSN